MFGSLGVPELLLIFAVILIVFGPRKIPEIGRMLGKAMGEFRKATDDLKSTIEREVRLEELKSSIPSAIDFTTPYEAVSRSEPPLATPAPVALTQGPEVFESSSRQVADRAVVESTSLQVFEGTQPEHSAGEPLDDSSDPLEDSTTRRLEDSPTTRRVIDSRPGSKPDSEPV